MTIPQLKAETRSRRADQRPHATPRTSPMPSAKARAGNGRRSIITTTASVVSRFAALRRLGACLVLGLDVRAFCGGALRAGEALAMRTTYTGRPSAQRRKDREVPRPLRAIEQQPMHRTLIPRPPPANNRTNRRGRSPLRWYQDRSAAASRGRSSARWSRAGAPSALPPPHGARAANGQGRVMPPPRPCRSHGAPGYRGRRD